MSLSLGKSLKIRTMIYLAAEHIPFFWPMRTFIHHNPLHGLEHLPFADAVKQGEQLFHARGFLPRKLYQDYWHNNQIDQQQLQQLVKQFVNNHATVDIELNHWLTTLMTEIEVPVTQTLTLCNANDIYAVLTGDKPNNQAIDSNGLNDYLKQQLLSARPLYEIVDCLYGSDIGKELDEWVIKSCLDFFDEGQSVWNMPKRKQGFFVAWRNIACRNIRFFIRGLHIDEILQVDETAEGIIAYVMETLGIPEEQWIDYFSHELARLHGWAGFIRWRERAKHYFWTQSFPADLVDFMAVRLTLALALLNKRSRGSLAYDVQAITTAITNNIETIYLRYELYNRQIIPAMAPKVERALQQGNSKKIEQLFKEYVIEKRNYEASIQAKRLLELAEKVNAVESLKQLSVESLDCLLKTLAKFEYQEGMIWLQSMEVNAMSNLLKGLDLSQEKHREKRPFVQALFCIDTRSERIRRHLESVGDYQTYGIAGFFGVPVSFIELGKGSETHLCPVLLTPKNLVPEITAAGYQDEAALSSLEKGMHELKESVLTPFVTVEAIGLLFGFDMVGKTFIPQSYNRWRKKMHPQKPPTRLLIDKLSRAQADSVVRAVQRSLIVKSLQQEFGLKPEQINDVMIRELREIALGNQQNFEQVTNELNLNEQQATAFIERLQKDYRINPSFAQMQLERLGRIGFTLDEQVLFVRQGLRSIGLTNDFSRFVLLVGHGSHSENNPFESALDCGACGGNHGLVSARILAQMANKPEVRRQLNKSGFDIPDDAWFIPALHNTTTDKIKLYDLELLPPSHLIYLDRLRSGISAASRLCAKERLSTLMENEQVVYEPSVAYHKVQRNAMDWSQVRPEWGLSGNSYFIIARRHLTQNIPLLGRAFLHSYDYRLDQKQRLLETILTGPLVVGQWINMEHYFSVVDNENFGSGSKVYHNVADRLGVMTGNLSDLRTGLPSQTVLKNGLPYHQPLRLITVIEAPFQHAINAIERVVAVKNLVFNGWIRLLIVDQETNSVSIFEHDQWVKKPMDQFFIG